MSRGQCGSGGHGIRIKKAYVERGYLIIEIVYRNPGQSCRKTWGLTNPFLLIRLKNNDLDIVFEKFIETYECDYN
ncbi:protease complex subunit PrcB family protein [Carboxylicivirga caseinilyticus]|uniref:protease complex subunit PrcB family protein n=1 Tax=Carboxylicivirga caseinilyticus TaxID=3417572 RepID=UPI003D33EA95